MSVHRESGIEFDFTAARAVVRPDKEPSGGVWPNVDFRVDEGSRELLIEVKSWSPHRYKTQAERLEADLEFGAKLTSEAFRHKIVSKFLGTTAYLAWTSAFVSKPILYVVLLDKPRRDRAALLVTFKDRLRPSFPKTAPWTHPIQYAVLDLETFQAHFGQYPCKRV